jgi:spermidine synthase
LVPERRSISRRSLLRGIAGSTAVLSPSYLSAQPAERGEKPIDTIESRYNNIYIYRRGPFISMTFGYNRRLYTESVYDTRDERILPVEYTQFMTVALAYIDAPSRILQIGLGGGRTSWYVHRHIESAYIDIAEIDPAVISLATKYFGIRPNEKFRPVALDGRLFLTRNPNIIYDAIFIDAYRGPFVPFHLLTKEFYTLCASRISTNGAVAQNVAPETMVFDAAVATMKSVFKQLDFFPAAGGNVILVGYNREERFSDAELQDRAKAIQQKFNFKHDLQKLVGARRKLLMDEPTKVLTDDFAPVEALHTIEKHNRKWE